ncbi:MAG: hypothetical protein WBL67_21350 [Nitrososphaeraceae archaeon]
MVSSSGSGGGGGDDKIKSGGGDDTNFGDNRFGDGDGGDDKIKSGDGDDTNSGGTGADKFNCGKRTDTVTDFNEAEGDRANKNCENVSESL